MANDDTMMNSADLEADSPGLAVAHPGLRRSSPEPWDRRCHTPEPTPPVDDDEDEEEDDDRGSSGGNIDPDDDEGDFDDDDDDEDETLWTTARASELTAHGYR